MTKEEKKWLYTHANQLKIRLQKERDYIEELAQAVDYLEERIKRVEVKAK